jgi:hypothetical protein
VCGAKLLSWHSRCGYVLLKKLERQVVTFSWLDMLSEM